MSDTSVVINGLDLVECIKFIDRKNSKYLALLLDDLEMIEDPESEKFKLIKKVVLDYFNDYTRSIIRLISGDV